MDAVLFNQGEQDVPKIKVSFIWSQNEEQMIQNNQSECHLLRDDFMNHMEADSGEICIKIGLKSLKNGSNSNQNMDKKLSQFGHNTVKI